MRWLINEKISATKQFITIFTVVFILFIGCEKDNTPAENSRKYHKSRRNCLQLYPKLHPLRSSRIGIESADSALFTFSEGEVSRADADVTNLLEILSTLTTKGLTEEEIDNSKLMLSWLYGERFALNKLCYYRNNPVLYCWIINEALWGIPSRLSPPNENEMAYYKKRLLKIPGLLDNAKNLIEKPSQLHTELSMDMIAGLLNKFDSLEILISNRYKTDLFKLDSTLKYIEEFRDFIQNDLSRRSYGKMILGTENITKIFYYDEHILSNPNLLISSAEKKIDKLLLSKKALSNNLSQRAAVETPGNSLSPIDITRESGISTMIREISDNPTGQRGTTTSKTNIPEILFTENPGRFDYYRKNSYLSTPYPQEFPITWIPPTLHSSTSRQDYLLISRDKIKPAETTISNQLTNKSFFVYTIIRALSGEKAYSQYIATKDTLRTLLCSETLKFGSLFHVVENSLNKYHKMQLQIRIHDINSNILDLARMVIVFRLHNGNYSMEMAKDFLVEKTGLDEIEATYNVKTALVSPSIAYPGITRIILDEMDKKLRTSDYIKLRGMSTLELLQSNMGLPIPMVHNKYFK